MGKFRPYWLGLFTRDCVKSCRKMRFKMIGKESMISYFWMRSEDIFSHILSCAMSSPLFYFRLVINKKYRWGFLELVDQTKVKVALVKGTVISKIWMVSQLVICFVHLAHSIFCAISPFFFLQIPWNFIYYTSYIKKNITHVVNNSTWSNCPISHMFLTSSEN